MTETKRKTHTSTAVKQRYNIAVRIPKEMAAAFKAKCLEKGIPQAQVIKKAIEQFLSE